MQQWSERWRLQICTATPAIKAILTQKAASALWPHLRPQRYKNHPLFLLLLSAEATRTCSESFCPQTGFWCCLTPKDAQGGEESDKGFTIGFHWERLGGKAASGPFWGTCKRWEGLRATAKQGTAEGSRGGGGGGRRSPVSGKQRRDPLHPPSTNQFCFLLFVLNAFRMGSQNSAGSRSPSSEAWGTESSCVHSVLLTP